ncbi:protein-disulfide reductase DsbD [Neptunomonas antarctica]|uniref:Thiol:disulfide interchange protein DsbD n=1 Tax=Neptunomonas antarctica TaxID=619304 RepID=A0A1N7P3I8_9GAMM|nr:protein-disulfide reductase DsbD [Neptunomonas antarctica]SIT05087.1 thiol:disulfide interchange protein DsbD [Neptunomonas antarctica]
MPSVIRTTIKIMTTLCFLIMSFSVAQAGVFDKISTFGQSAESPLPVEKAFVFVPEVNSNGEVILRWDIADRYYLYRDRMKIIPSETIEVVSRSNGATDAKDDPLFGSVEVFHKKADITLQVRSVTGSVASGSLAITYQGCWEGGICYPPVTTSLALIDMPAVLEKPVDVLSATTNKAVSESIILNNQPSLPVAPVLLSEQDQFARLISGDSLWLTLGAFFLAGLALSLTPCVFPMIPIISSIIAGHGHKITTKRAVFLSTVYVLAVSVTYTVAGVLAGLFGENLQAAFQNSWIIGFFSLIFGLLALSMFGFYDLQLPNTWQSKLSKSSHHQQGGTVAGVAIMGLLSALIVGPCMAAPLAGALIYIGHTGDPVMGGLALFTLSMGMGVPILLVGASAGKLLPKAGLWMDAIKAGFGVALLLMAIWMLDRVVSIEVTIGLTAVVLIITAIYMRAIDPLPKDSRGWHKLWKGVGIMFLLYGVALLIGLLSGGNSLLYPLKGLASNSVNVAQAQEISFITVTSIKQLDPVLQEAKRAGKPVMLDFYADWCISCIELEHVTFADTEVQQALSHFVRVKVDITANDKESKALNKAYQVIGPPALIFYNQAGTLHPELTLVGVIDPKDFIRHLMRVSGT